MLEKPAVQDDQLIGCLRTGFGLNIGQINFLPIGADRNTAVFRAIADDATPYFMKLRSGIFDEMSLIVPKLLHDQQIASMIPPLATHSGRLWADLENFKVAVFPYVEGGDGYQIDLSDRHWINFGHALRALHTAALPAAITNRIQQERYSDQWRKRVSQFQTLVEEQQFTDRVATALAAFVRQKKSEISNLIQRAEYLASVLQTQSNPFVLCHADIHAGNMLIDAEDHLYLVDWDTLILAPKERDLMFVGGGLFLNQRSPEEEERLFYQGYGQTQVNPLALAYYRYERIVQDIAAYCEEILLTDEGGQDRENGLNQLMRQFRPDNVIDIAYRGDKNPPELYR